MFYQRVMSAHRCGDSRCVDLFALEYLLNVLSEADAWIKGRDFLTALNLKIAPRDELTSRQGAKIPHEIRAPIAQSYHSYLYRHERPPLRGSLSILDRIVIPNKFHIRIFVY